VKFEFTRIYKKFLLSYILILFIPLLSGYISYKVSINIATSNSIESSLMLLNQSKDVLDGRLNEVSEFTKQLAIKWIDPEVADEHAMLETNIKNHINQWSLQFITGEKSLEKDWDEYLQGFKKLDLNRYVEIMKETYDKSK
jgi:hypothetical protein